MKHTSFRGRGIKIPQGNTHGIGLCRRGNSEVVLFFLLSRTSRRLKAFLQIPGLGNKTVGSVPPPLSSVCRFWEGGGTDVRVG